MVSIAGECFRIESSVRWMSMYDQPDFLVVVPGNDNRLFQALAHYITGNGNDFRQVRQAVSFLCSFYPLRQQKVFGKSSFGTF